LKHKFNFLRGGIDPFSGCPTTQIKLLGQVVGRIVRSQQPVDEYSECLWKVTLMVYLNKDWKWVTLKAKFPTEPAAREYLNENFQRITKLDLRPVPL
jgi:hypothetical protein